MSQRQQKCVTREVICPADPIKEETRLYLHHADKILAAFNSFKDKDRFYFVEISFDMTYHGPGFAVRMADPPYYLGTILRTSVENPDLFSGRCPRCGRILYSHAFNGSPISGRVHLSCKCPDCSWSGSLPVSGWKKCSDSLRRAQAEDKKRLTWTRILHPFFKPATLDGLLDYIGISKTERSLPAEQLLERIELGQHSSILFNEDGSIIVETEG